MRANHLSDDRLIELCLLDALSSVEQQHLLTCARCDARRVRMQRLLEDVSEAATAAADAAFPLDRLNRQQARILARLQHEGRPARVIAFPAGHAPHEPIASRTRPASRWIAAAPVGGRVVGVKARRFGPHKYFPRAGVARVIASHTVEQPELRAPGTTGAIREVAATISDDEFLDQLETAIDGPTAAALQPLDDLTPLAWEVR
jgi:hypothetical protein